jgi:putative hydrolase of the HAD superfamily
LKRLDAIVLDLDDTLLDTTGLLLPDAERRAVRAMRAAGLPFTETDALTRLAAHRSAGDAASAFRRLAEAGTGDDRAAHALSAIGERAFLDYTVPPLRLHPRVDTALDDLSTFAPLALFTLGVPDTQRAKVARLGLGPRLCDVVYVDVRTASTKTLGLASLLERNAWTAARVVVVGDSLTSDVAAAVELGCPAVHVRSRGERAHDRTAADAAPWRSVDHVDEVAAILGEAGYSRRPDVAS